MPRQHLTPNACLVCRKKRTKCDGEMPCRRCRSRNEECAYEDKKWRTKDHLRSEIERLRNEQRQDHALIKALTNNDPEQWDMLVDRVRADEPPGLIVEWITSSRSHEDKSLPLRVSPADIPSDASHGPPFPSQQPISPDSVSPGPMRQRTSSFSLPRSSGSFLQPGCGVTNGIRRHSHSVSASPSGTPTVVHPTTASCPWRSHATLPPAPLHVAGPSILGSQPLHEQRPITRIPCAASFIHGPILGTWTSVTSDVDLIRRLLANFFAGTFPSLSLVSQPHFAKGLGDSNSTYCSQALVNAVLGRACGLARASSQLVSSVSFGDAFLGEAKRLLASEQTHAHLPSIQALGELSMAEVLQGNDEEASNLIRAAIRGLIRLVSATPTPAVEEDEQLQSVRALAYCGCFSLVRMFTLLTGDLEPKTGPLFMRLNTCSGHLGDDDAPGARVERGIALQMRFFAELRHCPSLSRFVFEVTEAVHTFASCNFSRAMTAVDLEASYDKCLGSYGQFIKSCGPDINGSAEFLFAQIWYHYCLFCLLRPFISSRVSFAVDSASPGPSGFATPATVCQRAAESIISLASTYQTQHSFAYFPPLLPYVVFSAALYELAHATPTGSLNRAQPGLTTPPISSSPPIKHESVQDSCGSPNFSWPGIFHDSQPSLATGPPVPPNSIPQMNSASHHHATGFSAKFKQSPAEASRYQQADGGLTDDRPSSWNETPCWNSGVGLLPSFSSRPADLVAIGSLQLASMGASHPGAAASALLLRHLDLDQGSSWSSQKLQELAESLGLPPCSFAVTVMRSSLGFPWSSDTDPSTVDKTQNGRAEAVHMPVLVSLGVGNDASRAVGGELGGEPVPMFE